MLAALTAAVLAQDAARFTADWWRDAALGFAIVLVVALVLSIGTRRYVRRQQRAADRAEDDADGRRARRRATVVGLIGGTLQIVLWFVVLLMLLSWLGVPLGPVFASAGVVGVALGFGAQTVVKDTLAGLFIALEGQFDVGDVLDLQTEGGPRQRHGRGADAPRDVGPPVRRYALGRAERLDPGDEQQDPRLGARDRGRPRGARRGSREGARGARGAVHRDQRRRSLEAVAPRTRRRCSASPSSPTWRR